MKTLERKFFRKAAESQSYQDEQQPELPPQRTNVEPIPRGTFPRSIKYVQDGTLPVKTAVPSFYRNTSPIPNRRVPPYIPVPRTNKFADSSCEQFKKLPDLGDPQFPTPERNLPPFNAMSRQGMMPAAEANESRFDEYPHSFYPFRRPVGMPSEMNENPPLNRLMQERMSERKKSPAYFRAMRESGGVEDTIEGLEESLQKNEIRAIGPVRFGYDQWSEIEPIPKLPRGNLERSPHQFPNRILLL